MAKRFFTVKTAARIMQCNPSTIYRLLAEGWLKRPPGWGINGKSARVSQKSLFNLMRFDAVNNKNGRSYKEFDKRRKNFKRFFSQTSIAKRFSMVKRKPKAQTRSMQNAKGKMQK